MRDEVNVADRGLRFPSIELLTFTPFLVESAHCE